MLKSIDGQKIVDSLPEGAPSQTIVTFDLKLLITILSPKSFQGAILNGGTQLFTFCQQSFQFQINFEANDEKVFNSEANVENANIS